MCSSNDHSHCHLRRKFLTLSGGLLLTSLFPGEIKANAPTIDLPRPGPRDVCPVCGMFVAKYPDWVASILFQDGHVDHFDGAKDFFKYIMDLKKYAQGRTKEDIVGMGVTDYYEVKLIDATKALYVVGSDVYGPMGHEFIPHPTQADADEFYKDHKGKRILTFENITKALVYNLDEGIFQG
ncbi:MAG: nitrous oxide reductase accessory protein NosL [Methylocystaceae bacterium]|nr:nitrous oxide reductase accessory protein NosL [Methylocystaceae bacterium]